MKFKLLKNLILIFIILSFASNNCFGNTEVVSPKEYTVQSGDSFFVSVKITDEYITRVTIYQEETYHIGPVEKIIQVKESELRDGSGNEVKSITYTVQGEIFEKYTDVEDLTIEDLKLLSKGEIQDQDGNFLKLSNGKELKYFGESVYRETEEYKSVNGVGLYYREYENAEPGIYRVLVESTDDKGEIISKSSCYILLKETKEEEQEKTPAKDVKDIIEEQDGQEKAEESKGLFEKIMDFLKKIFK